MNIGEEALSEGDILQRTLKYRVLERYYLSTILTELAANPWIGARKRAPLTKIDCVLPGEANPTNKPVNYSPYRYMYNLPADCVRPLEIQGNHFFVIEEKKLLTDLNNAALLYITNGYVSPVNGVHAYPNDTYKDYADIEIDPVFSDYLEKIIASKVATKLSTNFQIHQMMFSEAMLARKEAINTIRALSNSRQNGERRWDEYLNNADRDAYLQQLPTQQNRG
jgi:hypothetical protein